MNRLYWVRHGENTANLTKEFSHRVVDYSLTPKGVLQAHQTAQYFRDKAIQEVYCSPLKRAVETAKIIAAEIGLHPTVVENFREINVGDLDGQSSPEAWGQHDAILAAWRDGHPEVGFPGGEDYFTLWKRIHEGYLQIVAGKEDRNLLVVGHGGSFTLTLKDLCPSAIFNWSAFANCAITELLVEDRNGYIQGVLVRWAGSGHLSGAAAVLVPGTPNG